MFLALVTLVLVVVTWEIARQTRDVAKETRALAQADVRPVLADVPSGAPPTKITYDHVEFPKSFKITDGAAPHVATWSGIQSLDAELVVGRSVVIRNIGNGPARVQAVRLNVTKSGDSTMIGPWSTSSIIPPGETARLMAIEATGRWKGQLGDDFDRTVKNTGFTMTVEYSDISGEQCQFATVRVEGNYYKRGGVHMGASTLRRMWPASSERPRRHLRARSRIRVLLPEGLASGQCPPSAGPK